MDRNAGWHSSDRLFLKKPSMRMGSIASALAARLKPIENIQYLKARILLTAVLPKTYDDIIGPGCQPGTN